MFQEELAELLNSFNKLAITKFVTLLKTKSIYSKKKALNWSIKELIYNNSFILFWEFLKSPTPLLELLVTAVIFFEKSLYTR